MLSGKWGAGPLLALEVSICVLSGGSIAMRVVWENLGILKTSHAAAYGSAADVE